MSEEWKPAQDTVNKLLNEGIIDSFIFDAVPEFALEQKEKNIRRLYWELDFFWHVVAQWRKFKRAWERGEIG